jgi:hypothetical protein
MAKKKVEKKPEAKVEKKPEAPSGSDRADSLKALALKHKKDGNHAAHDRLMAAHDAIKARE